MATKKKSPSVDLPSQADPRAPLDGALLLSRSQGLLAELEADLLVRARSSAAVREALRARHESERAQKRTADPLEVWERSFVTQVAASWLLSCVFVRTLEDRGLLGHARIAGPGATDSQRLFFEMAPSLTERDYLLAVFRELSHLSAARDLFDPKRNPVWLLGPSAALAKKLLELFRSPSAEAPGLRFGQADTRFLGDLYQDLSADVRERFALLQTPHFVEAYILDRTLERSIARFGLNETSLIDPTCGSGHFLLGAFERLFDHRLRNEPGLDVREAARLALGAVYGADINPYAVAIARFRLTLAFLEKAGYRKLADSPELPLHLVVGDSLLHNPQHAQANLGELAGQTMGAWAGQEFSLEDEAAARDVLHRKFTAVVGNPPYITVKDAALREEYRRMYATAFKTYSLGVPFTERFFQLAKHGGFVGMITANSFMKREFGKKIIEEYLPQLNLDGVVNTSGAYIPGHGTPTVLLFGSNEPPVESTVLTVLAKRGEPSTPSDPEHGHVWRSIADHGNEVGFENDFLSVANIARSTLGKHPWSLGGGGASELKELLEARAGARLGDLVRSMGRVAHTGNDEAFVAPRAALVRRGLKTEQITTFVEGEIIRDWALAEPTAAVFPYIADDTHLRIDESMDDERIKHLWPYRTMLWLRREPNGTHREIGLTWYEFSRFHPERFEGQGITFAFVATHNHFVLDRGGKVFKQSAPIIKLKEGATEEDHLALLAYLNSSTACFWMKQVMMNKGGSGIGRGVQDEAWEGRFEFDGTKMGTIPVPANWQSLAPLGRVLVRLAEEREKAMPGTQIRGLFGGSLPTELGTPPRDMAQRMVAVQEELDWTVYRLFGLLEGEHATKEISATERAIGPWDRFVCEWDKTNPLELPFGHRPFEQLMDPAATQWFARNKYPLPGGVPFHFGAAYGELLAERIRILREGTPLRLIETAEHKRRWKVRDVKEEAQAAAEAWALDGLEKTLTGSETRAASAMGLEWLHTQASVLTGDALPTYFGDAIGFARRAIAAESVPFLAAYRHTEAGLEKRAQWERVWELQRAEDRGETVPPFDPAPKYDQKDYRDANAWRLRGKLDVPKERFISYPGCESDQDKEPVYGWAGWNHLEQAQALAALYQNRKTEEGWGKDRLTPLLAGLLELLPWVKQWHNEPSDEFGGLRLGDYFETFLDGECHTLGLTREALRAFRPAEKTRGRAPKATPASAPDEPEDADVDGAPAKAERKPRGRKKASS